MLAPTRMMMLFRVTVLFNIIMVMDITDRIQN